MFADDEKKFAQSIDQPIDKPVKRRAQPRKQAQPADDVPAKKRKLGRPKGSLNKFTVELQKVEKLFNKRKTARSKGPPMQPKDVLLEAMSYWHERATFLSNHARQLAEDEAASIRIDAVMSEADRYLKLACDAAEKVSPYCHPKVSNGLADSDVVAYVARLPTPAANSEEWAKESDPNRWKRPQ